MSSGTARVEPVAWRGLPRFSAIVLPAYAAAIVTAEMVTALVDARWGVGFHVIVLWALLLHFSSAKESSEAKVLLALCLAPLIRILSLAMPLGDVDIVYWFLIVSAPVIVAALLVARTLGLTRYDLGLTVRAIPVQLLVGATGVGLGIVEYFILKPEALIDGLTWQQAWLPALILLVATGFGEELVFRGVMQSASAGTYGKMAILLVAVVFAALHIGHKSAPDVAFAFIVGLFFGWVVARTQSLSGVALCHGVLNVMLYVIVPFTVLSSVDLGAGLARLWTDWGMAGLTLAALGVALLGTFYLLAVAARGAARTGAAVIGTGWAMAGLALAALGAALLGTFYLLAVAVRGA
ncbi:MAG: type II CAAX endopeptidase family protein, partial [Dehalococcoidia bacterium]